MLISCSKCKRMLLTENFRKHKTSRKSGFFSWCRSCEHASFQTDDYRAKRNAYHRQERLDGRHNPERDRRNSLNARRRFPEKQRARRELRRALDAGELFRPISCQFCGEAPVPAKDGRSTLQAHHEDYAKPLEVIWLCIACHALERRARGTKCAEQ